jgi:sulfatase maturation enzyme AslB (radical SAM superfamily)
MGPIARVVAAWGRILRGYVPTLAIEITRECPLRCPGCYAYGDDHLGGGVTLREVRDFKGRALVDGILRLVDEHQPLNVSLVGGEPLVRFRELDELLPILASRGIHTQLVTSAVRPIPPGWAHLRPLQIVVSIDGLQAEHDARRAPATYARVLAHIAGHQVTVHCTITRQQARQAGYLEAFTRFWSANRHTRDIWFSLFTPQVGERSEEVLLPEDRQRVIAELLSLRARYPTIRMPKGLIEAYADPPRSPQACIFARTTTSISADLARPITPCQFGGTPDCGQCGCMASAGFHALGRHRLPIGIRVGTVFDASFSVGRAVRLFRESRRVVHGIGQPELDSGR